MNRCPYYKDILIPLFLGGILSLFTIYVILLINITVYEANVNKEKFYVYSWPSHILVPVLGDHSLDTYVIWNTFL